jgi:hypothetical protein
MPALSRYTDNLLDQWITGTGVHSRVMSTANLGVLAGLPPQQIHDDLWRAIPKDRKNPEREIQDAINKALSDHHGGTYTARPKPTPVVRDGEVALQRIIEQGKIQTEVDLWEASPIRLWEAP